ncbi:MAG: hypothetical protein A3B17_00410 [Candidatus Yanofskybacteria bacterium RIFCSPLOWO2_01_FULL_45_72]|nr:MAG: hypothetical protein A3B17_00410 [Candidatus Yanofskybacteria bacterium RIFCSPLOWO2_01_FULL_45_72]
MQLLVLCFFTKNKRAWGDSERTFQSGTNLEVLKVFVRLSSEIEIINVAIYIELESGLQEISKMTNGWIKYLTQEAPQKELL